MSLALNIIAGALSTLAIASGTAMAIPASREFIFNTVAPYSTVYEQQEEKNEELENQRSQITNEIVSLQNQKSVLEERVSQLQNTSTADQQTIQNYLEQIDTLNRQIEQLLNIRKDFDNNSSITYRGSFNGILFYNVDDNGAIIYQTNNEGTQYDKRYCTGEVVFLEIDNYLSVNEVVNKSLSFDVGTFLYGYNAYQIVIGPYGIMWHYPTGEYRFATDARMNLKFTFNDVEVSADDLRNSIDNYMQYTLEINYTYNLNNDGLISDLICNFKVTSA